MKATVVKTGEKVRVSGFISHRDDVKAIIVNQSGIFRMINPSELLVDKVEFDSNNDIKKEETANEFKRVERGESRNESGNDSAARRAGKSVPKKV
jgi:hypothetical protein